MKSRLTQLIRTHARQNLISINYHLGNYKNVVWIFGDGRSGTTWLSEIINFDGRLRSMFEPFHPIEVEKMRSLALFQYVRPQEDNAWFEALARTVFSGRLQHPRVDTGNRRVLYEGLIIKDIFANLFAGYVRDKFPHVRQILLLRHPFSVAVSKEKLKRWHWMTEPTEFLAQRSLVEDYLSGFVPLIRSVSTFFEKQVLTWAIVHLVLFNQFHEGELFTVFYEDLCRDPAVEIARIWEFLEIGENSDSERVRERVKRPSRFAAKHSPIKNDGDLLGGWKTDLSKEQIRRGIEILEAFGLAEMYNENVSPNLRWVTRPSNALVG